MLPLTTSPRIVAVTGLVLMTMGSIATATDSPIVRGDTVELRDDRGRTLWRVVLPENVRGGLQPVRNGWRVNQNQVIDRFGRVRSQSQPESESTPATISNGAWDPVTIAIPDESVDLVLPPVFTGDGDVVFLTYSSNPDRMLAVRSIGNTNTWEAPVAIDADWPEGKLIADDLGNLTYVFRDFGAQTPYKERLSAVRYTPDDGWQERVVIGEVPSYFQTVVGAADAAGNLVVAIGQFGDHIYTATYDVSSDSWSRLNVLTTYGTLPTIAQSPSREQVAITYGISFDELLVRRFRFDTGWGPEVKVPGTERLAIYGGLFSEIPITVDNLGNITTFWETEFGILTAYPRLVRRYYATYGSYIPLSGPEPPKQFLPWKFRGHTNIYDWHAYGNSPSGSTLALVSRLEGSGVRYYSLYHDVNDGWGTTQNPFSHSGTVPSQNRLVWRSDETALAIVDGGDNLGLTTLFFSNENWETQRTLLPDGISAFEFELASSGLDVVVHSRPSGIVNSTWYRAPAQSLQRRNATPESRRPKR